MYAQKESLAIDGKAMYFRGRCQALALGLRPSDANPQPRISRIHADKAEQDKDLNPWKSVEIPG
jgi:hypothetical protein